MGTGLQGTFMISWAQTLIDGEPADTNSHLSEGVSWRWYGRALPMEGDGAALLLTASRDHAELRARAARVVRKMLQRPAIAPAELAADDADPLFRGAFVLSDGARFFTVVPIIVEDGAAPILLFPEDIPPADRDLSIVHLNDRVARPTPSEAPTVICFTPGTRLRTQTGDVAIEDLGPGDYVLTRDDGPQEVQWTGHRRMSGARLFAMPDQRPIRLRRGALGLDRPDADLIVSPEHRVLVQGAAARDLWGEPEVLVRAADLVGDRYITVDHSLRETWYVHLMLNRHQVIWANGLEVESFHPGYMGLDHLNGLQRKRLLEMRPELAADPHSYGPAARRMVKRAEAAILLGGAPAKTVSARH
jgi:hypothetical protein